MIAKMRLLVLLIFCSFCAEAQSYLYRVADDRDSLAVRPFLQRPMFVGVTVGSTGLGFRIKKLVVHNTSVMVGMNFLPLSLGTFSNLFSIASPTNLKASFSSAYLHLGYSFFHAAKSPFIANTRLVAGAAYFFSAKGTAVVKPNDMYFNKILVKGDALGEVTGIVDWKGVAPYLGMSFLKPISKNRLNVNLDLGTYYLKRPAVEIYTTKMMKGNENNQQQIYDNMKSYRWYPVLELNLNYRIN